MQMRQCPRSARRRAIVALLLALGVVVAPGASRADDADAPPPGPRERVVKIGPQAVVIVDGRGEVRMYDDPSQQAPECASRLSCWGKAVGQLGVLGSAVYEELTTNVEGSGNTLQSSSGVE